MSSSRRSYVAESTASGFGGQRTSPGREVEAEGAVGRPRAASSSSDVTGRCGRSGSGGIGPRLARARRAERPRRRAEDRRARGQGGRARRARGEGRGRAPPPALPARLLARARHGHVYIAYEYVPGRTLREAMRAGEIGDREAVEVAGAVARWRSRMRTAAASSTATSSRRTSCSPRRRRHRRAAARLRPGADGRVRHADGARRRARHARVRLARAAARARRRPRRPTSGPSA